MKKVLAAALILFAGLSEAKEIHLQCEGEQKHSIYIDTTTFKASVDNMSADLTVSSTHYLLIHATKWRITVYTIDRKNLALNVGIKIDDYENIFPPGKCVIVKPNNLL